MPTRLTETVFYEFCLQSFHDINGDSIGDFAGMIQKIQAVSQNRMRS
ncbi:hypothetical protein GCWU000342_02024 [Shuttleworthella satelles DSM 14600]|uniref:Uncharacterized protein n=1 Tax=Shuttleworthella satelles DSM 14600 TaxID=626523 RepID=C4GE78_9FIRM|nr:hypothetical protein GCWU000342_02024 [Shuttleworthia satelles DSM 14600]